MLPSQMRGWRFNAILLLLASLFPTMYAVPAITTKCGSTCTYIWFGEGCFWERQWAYVNIELDPAGPFKRTNETVSSRVGYGGSKRVGTDGLVCYHSEDGASDYEMLGHCEQVRVTLDAGKEQEQFAALCKDFFASFTFTGDGFVRPDPGDVGSAYRVTVGIPGGMKGSLYQILSAANQELEAKHNKSMVLKSDTSGNVGDETNTVWVMDSDDFPFFLGEQYHQFHADFHPDGNYPAWYQTDLWKLQIGLGNIPKGACPDGPHYMYYAQHFFA